MALEADFSLHSATYDYLIFFIYLTFLNLKSSTIICMLWIAHRVLLEITLNNIYGSILYWYTQIFKIVFPLQKQELRLNL